MSIKAHSQPTQPSQCSIEAEVTYHASVVGGAPEAYSSQSVSFSVCTPYVCSDTCKMEDNNPLPLR